MFERIRGLMMRGSRSILAAGLALAAASLFSAGTRAEDNMRAANAPLPGDVALYAKERTCAEALETPGYFRSINAAELADAQRRGVYACATFTGAFDGANQIYAWRSQDSYQGVSFINNRKPGELYLTGGDLPKLSGPVAPGPFVAKADAATGKEIWRTYLDNANVSGHWIAVLNLNILPSGNVLIAWSDHVAILDGDTGRIIAAQTLPPGPAANNSEDPPHRPAEDISLAEDEDILALIPDDPQKPMDVHGIIEHIVDPGEFLEVHRSFAENIIVGFGRVEGMVVGIVANQPAVRAGALDMDAAGKGARFIRFCNCFNIPLVTLVDVPGFMPGVEQERGGIIRHGAKLLFSYASCTTPKVTVILRKAYGGSYLAMCSQEMGADFVFAWPTAEIAVMGAEGAWWARTRSGRMPR